MGPAATGETGVAVELRQLRYFLEVARELHFGRAAHRVNLTQPALSRLVQGLERTLGAALFDRTTRKVALTPAGEALVPVAEDLVHDALESVDPMG